MNVRRFLTLVVGLLAAFGLSMGTASAAVYTPTTGSGTVSATSVGPDEAFTFVAEGFAPNSEAQLFADEEDLGTIEADEDGVVGAVIVLDESFCGEDVTIAAVGEGANGEDRTVTSVVSVVCKAGTGGGGTTQGGATGSGGTTSGSLPFTGAGVAGPALFGGLGLVAVGALFLVGTRRRSATR